MKNFKKILSVILVVTMFAALLSGCAKKNETSNQPTTDATQAPSTDVTAAPEANGNWEGEVSKIIVTYLTTGVEPKDIKVVEAAVNEMTVPKIGVEIEFKSISIFEALTQYSMWIASGEVMDVAIVAFTDISSYANQGMLLPLDDLITKNAPYIKQLGKELPIYDAAIVDGSAYGVAVVPPNYGAAGGFLIMKSALDTAGLSYENNTKVTLDDLGNIFAKIKEANPDAVPCGVVGLASPFGYTTIVDSLGTTPSSGVLIGTESTTVENMYESDEYYNFLKHLRDWYEKGYIAKDAATAEIGYSDNMKAGITAGYFMEAQPAFRPQLEKGLGEEVIQLNLIDPYVKSASSSASVYFSIPATSTDPDAAMRFINMLYEDAALTNLIQFGIEGQHYDILDPEIGLIGSPEGVDPEENGYINPLGIWGDQRKFLIQNEESKQENLVGFSETALANPTKGVGFCYDPTAMTSQIIAIDAVVNEYRAALETGSAELDKTYNEFVAKLKANGIDEVIADKQAQFDAWLAQQ